MMYSISSQKKNLNAPELTHNEKLAQIRSGKQLKRTKSGLQKKSVVVRGNDGSKIIKNQTEEKFEETGVTKKKRNYILYESKLSTEKNTQITEVKKKPVRQPSQRNEEKITIRKKRKEYLDNYQYHETKDLKEKNPKFKAIVEHKRLGDIIGGFYDETIVEHTRYSSGTYQPKKNPTMYSTKTTVIKTPYKPLQALYNPPLKTPYIPMRTTSTPKRLKTPYVPSRKSYIPSQTTTILPSYQTIQTTSFSSTKPLYEPSLESYKPIHKTIRPRKTPYHELRPHNTEIFREINSSRIGAKTPRYNTKPIVQTNRKYNNNYDYSSQTFHVKKPNNEITRRSDNVINYLKSQRGKTPQTYDTKKEVKTITSYKTREQPKPQNLNQNKYQNQTYDTKKELETISSYKTRDQLKPRNLNQNNYQTNTSKTIFTKVILSKTGSFTEDEPKGRFDDAAYGTRTITTVSRVTKTIEDDNDGNLSRNLKGKDYGFENGRNNQNENSKFEIKIEKKTEVFNDGAYGKGPSIRNKYKRKK